MFNKIKNKRTIITISITIILIFASIGLYQNINYKNNDNIEITQLKANSHRQMMGYIIKTANNKIIAIDGGTTEDTENFVKHINDLGGKVDYWFITHPHSDHAGVFTQLADENRIKIGKIYYTANSNEWYQQNAPERCEEVIECNNIVKNKKQTEEVYLNQNIKIDNIYCEILGIKNPEITTNAINNSSMVMKMNINKSKSILFLADSGIESGEKLLNNQKDKLKSYAVQIAHHGQNGVTEDVYKAIQPDICFWPTPEWIWNNDNGEGENTGPWATFETRKWIENLNIKQNIIEKDGDISITL